MKIVFLDTYSLADIDLSPISALGDFTAYDNTAPCDAVARARGAEVVIINKVPMTAEVLEACRPSLKLVCAAATGTNNIDTEAARRMGVRVMNVPAYSTGSVAEATISMALALLRNTVYYDRYVKSGDYSASGLIFNTSRPVSEIGGSRWGIIGLGAIGARVAQLAEAFGAKVAYHSVTGNAANGKYPHKTLEDLLAESDIVSVHTPLTDLTAGLIDAGRLRMMKPAAILINVARGGIIDEAALAEALDNGVIAGAGLDVFNHEPLPADSPLLNLENPDRLVAAPHCGWASKEARGRLVERIAANIRKFYGV